MEGNDQTQPAILSQTETSMFMQDHCNLQTKGIFPFVHIAGSCRFHFWCDLLLRSLQLSCLSCSNFPTALVSHLNTLQCIQINYRKKQDSERNRKRTIKKKMQHIKTKVIFTLGIKVAKKMYKGRRTEIHTPNKSHMSTNFPLFLMLSKLSSFLISQPQSG